MRIETEAEVIQADVINVVPPMKAGQVAMTLGLADSSGFLSGGAAHLSPPPCSPTCM